MKRWSKLSPAVQSAPHLISSLQKEVCWWLAVWQAWQREQNPSRLQCTRVTLLQVEPSPDTCTWTHLPQGVFSVSPVYRMELLPSQLFPEFYEEHSLHQTKLFKMWCELTGWGHFKMITDGRLWIIFTNMVEKNNGMWHHRWLFSYTTTTQASSAQSDLMLPLIL